MFTRFLRPLRTSRLSGLPMMPRQNRPSIMVNNLILRRGFASQKPPETPKLRWFVLIFVAGTALFVVTARNYDGKRRGEISLEEYERIKASGKKTAQPAFSARDAFVVFVLGGPGSGKGTQCDNIVRDYNFVHLSAGDLLRAEQNRPGSQFGDLIRSCIKSGQIVPQEVTISLLKNAMKDNMDRGIHHFLIDGFPRAMDQALTFEDSVVHSKFTLFFDCPESVMLGRLLKRGETSGRADDNIESIHKRFKVFVNQSMPVVDYFDMANKVTHIKCDQPVDAVYKQIRDTLAAHDVAPKKGTYAVSA